MARRPDNSTDLPEPTASTQEPYLRIIAPNLDKISRASFRRGSVERRRIMRALIVLGIIVSIIAIIAAISIAVSVIG